MDRPRISCPRPIASVRQRVALDQQLDHPRSDGSKPPRVAVVVRERFAESVLSRPILVVHAVRRLPRPLRTAIPTSLDTVPDPATYRPAPGSIPVEPGVYRFRDQHGRVIYVGKAKSLRSRLTSYFADVASLHPRTRQMVTTAAKVEWTVVNTEVEALQLEYN